MLEINNFNSIRISLASPEAILQWSYGEVTKPETINYRTLKPERDGLFCEKIFGPTRDWECHCGKYRRVRYRGVVCDKCGVTVTRSKVRRERMAHIQLATPVSHIWFVKGAPSRLSLLLDITPRNLERVLYFAAYIVTHVNDETRDEVRVMLEQMYDNLIASLEKGADDKHGQISTSLTHELQKQEVEFDTSNTDTAKRLLQQEYETLRLTLDEREQDVTEEEIIFRGRLLVEEGRKISESTLDQLDEYYEQELAAIETQHQEAELIRGASREQREQAARDQHSRIDEKRDRDIDDLLKTKKKKLDALDAIRIKRILSETEYSELRTLIDAVSDYNSKNGGHDIHFNEVCRVEMGASAIRGLIERTVDLDELADTLQLEINASHNTPKRKKLAKRLRVVEAFRKSGNKPEWMIMTVLPVIPPDLRPMVQLDVGRFATSDLNDLYRRVINRNNRLKRLLDINAPDIIVRNEKRMLQEAVDALIDNGRRGRAVSGKGKHRLKSLSDMLKGKQGRFRQNLLGKRVDYSGRSVIVVGPNLKLDQCGLPKKMALELFKPFVMRRLVEKGTSNIKAAKKLVERVKPEVWDVLEEVIKDYLVLLNRAPSLHRLSIQAFQANLIEGSAIQLHPLVCTAFNADFDGDQMAVHVPLSVKAQEEARLRMLSKYNILSPATGDPIITPSQDIVLGCFYLTIVRDGAKGSGKVFTNSNEALLAFDKGVVDIQAPIWVRMDGVMFRGDRNDRQMRELKPAQNGKPAQILLETTVGRLIFNQELLPPLQYRNHEVVKDGLKNIIADCYKWYTSSEYVTDAELDTIRKKYPNRSFSHEELLRYYGSERTAEQADKIKSVGFHYAMRGGMTVGVQDIKVPEDKRRLLEEAEKERQAIERRNGQGMYSDKERYRAVVEIWQGASKTMTDLVRTANQNQPFNPVSMMVRSKARGNINQLTQMAGMRGLMADPTGKIIELPIKSNFREGLTVLEYFVSTHGGRKGLADTALRTADAGYLTRRLIDVAQDNIVNVEDCGTTESLLIHDQDNEDEKLDWRVPSRAVGRVAARSIVTSDGEILVEAGKEITEEVAKLFDEKGIKHVFVRTPLHCQAEYGICRQCYGRNLATGKLVEIGEAVGIIAAQSIGEPGTQLTLRTFHTGGVASADDITQGLPRIIEIFEARVKEATRAVLAVQDGRLEVLQPANKEGQRHIKITDEGDVFDEQTMPEHFVAAVEHGAEVHKGDILARSNNVELREQQALRARQHGIVNVSGRSIAVVSHYSDATETAVAQNARLRKNVSDGGKVVAGQLVTEGSADPREVLEIQGRDALQTYMLKEAQMVYRPQGVYVNDKHLEVIIRQMLRRVRINESGDTHYLPGERVDIGEFARVNAEIWAQGGIPATASSLLLGITRASLETDSFLSAASFQETTRVLTEAAITGKVDHLRGLKENVVIGKLIPAGTGVEARRQLAEEVAARKAELANKQSQAAEPAVSDVSAAVLVDESAAALQREKDAATTKAQVAPRAIASEEDRIALDMLRNLQSDDNIPGVSNIDNEAE
ncbi:MAG: DNA-directed RNA polymerase subunit beta' [Roseiflexaceae bacterium]